MKKAAFSLAMSLMIAGSVLAQSTTSGSKAPVNPNVPGQTEPASNPTAAKITFKEMEYNFGEIEEGPKATHEFVFKNTGHEPLVLSNVKASCGCTTPSWPKEPILPQQEGKILVTYNTQGRPGAFTKTITITSNAEPNTAVINIKGKVNQAPEVNTTPLKEPSLLSPDAGN